MKKIGCLNSSKLGHFDTLTVGDCGLPVPKGVQRLDLAVTYGVPSFYQVFDVIDKEAKFQKATIAAELKVSVGYLSKIFKREQHCTMSDYMRHKKIEIACLMLANTEQSIDEIALALPFCSQSHFGALFSKLKGCSPSIYRKLSRLQRHQP